MKMDATFTAKLDAKWTIRTAIWDLCLQKSRSEPLAQFCHNIAPKAPAVKRTLNTTINRSKNEKNDGRYTQLAEIEEEVAA